MVKFDHFNFNVLDLEKSLAFYKEALDLVPVKEKKDPDGAFVLIYLGDGSSGFTLELTWLNDRKEPYNLGEGEFHLAFTVDDFGKMYEKHKAMGIICFENKEMGVYFIADPDGYWIEIVPEEERQNIC
ncbi:VOC family protein [[Clostridium] hylemonae]|uniref:VOC family protein n=1 Tax=[Clostridium] hylemonae TaxID=89153 RepID=UPI0011063418|nr:VOC family protein [[Clostridium] hylemonae]